MKKTFLTAFATSLFASTSPVFAGGTPGIFTAEPTPAAIETPPGFENCYPVMGTLSSNQDEVLYWTGSPALGNCATPVIDGQAYVPEDEEEGEEEVKDTTPETSEKQIALK